MTTYLLWDTFGTLLWVLFRNLRIVHWIKGAFTPVDRLLCSETGIKIITMLLFILGVVRFHTAKFLN